ncbi:hypothetical protein PTKIN_Ptkin10aG0090400 [Pterospermum kingtungense]
MEDNNIATIASPVSVNDMFVGLRFEPSDALLMGFLYDRLSGNNMLHPGHDMIIKECDLYGEKEPWEIWDLYGGDNILRQSLASQDLYFFTQLKKKTSNGSRINRSLGKGTWKGEDSGKQITYSRFQEKPKPLGFKKRFRYEDGNGRGHGHGWILHEYSLDASLHKNEDGLVLCRLRKNRR